MSPISSILNVHWIHFTWAHDWGIKDHCFLTTQPCCLFSLLCDMSWKWIQRLLFLSQAARGSSSSWVSYLSCLWHNIQPVPWLRHARVGSRWHISQEARVGSASALAKALQPASLIIPSTQAHFQGPSPSLKEAVLFLQVLLGSSLESKCSAIWCLGQAATAEDTFGT